jgi:hypothetical protein
MGFNTFTRVDYTGGGAAVGAPAKRSAFQFPRSLRDGQIILFNPINGELEHNGMFDTSKIGHSFPPFTADIERSKIRELALAIGDDNPIYSSRQAAQAAGYPDVPVLPTMGTMFMFWGNAHFVEQLAELGLNVAGYYTWKKYMNILPLSMLAKP